MFNGRKQEKRKMEGGTSGTEKERQRTLGRMHAQTGGSGNVSSSASKGPE